MASAIPQRSGTTRPAFIALTKLEAFDPRKSRIAELRFFGGLSLEETGHVLDLSLATVERDWQGARAWLFRTLSAPGASDR